MTSLGALTGYGNEQSGITVNSPRRNNTKKKYKNHRGSLMLQRKIVGNNRIGGNSPAVTIPKMQADKNMMNKAKKKEYIKEMTTYFDKSEAVIVAHYQGLTVSQLDKLRKEMRQHGIIFKITKNRITKLALEKTKSKELAKLFSGPTAVALSDDAITSAKILTKFSKDNDKLKILGGIMGNDILDVAGVKNVATLPSLDEARAKIVGILRSPAQKIASILLAPASKIAILALEKSKKQN